MNFNALSLFSSAGIAETYFEKHGINVKVASELLPERVKIYQHLYPKVNMVQGDITDKNIFNKIIDLAQQNHCNFIIATPPCQGMSTAGKQLKNDPRNRLILQVIEAIKILKPEFVIIENVPAILNTKIDINGTWINIDTYLKEQLGSNYFFNENNVVNTMYYGIAQSRERCVYLLSKKTTMIHWEFPEPSRHILTLRDAIGELPSLDPLITDISTEKLLSIFPDFYKKMELGLSFSKWHYPPKHKYRHVIAMQHTPEGQSAWSNKIFYPTLANGKKSKGYKNTYKRQWWNKPAYTVTKYTSRIGSQENGHPGYPIVNSLYEEFRIWSDARVFSIFELMRVSSLPDDWNIPEWASSNVIREVIGEGVPPKLLDKALIQLEKLINVQNSFQK